MRKRRACATLTMLKIRQLQRSFSIFAPFGLAILMMACGQTGPLYLPDKNLRDNHLRDNDLPEAGADVSEPAASTNIDAKASNEKELESISTQDNTVP